MTPLSFSLSCIGEENGNPLQCSCLENPKEGGAWWAAIYGVTQNRTRLKQHSSSSSSSSSLYENRSVQFSSVSQSCPTLCDPMNRSMPGLPIHHHLLEFTQTHIHRVHDAIQPPILSCPLLLLPPIPPSIRVFFSESTLRMRWPVNFFSVL